MVRTQIQLPDALYQRAKRFAAEREVSLAELTRRGLELLLERYPTVPAASHRWKLPRFKGGGSKVSLERLRDVIRDDQETRGLARR